MFEMCKVIYNSVDRRCGYSKINVSTQVGGLSPSKSQ